MVKFQLGGYSLHVNSPYNYDLCNMHYAQLQLDYIKA